MPGRMSKDCETSSQVSRKVILQAPPHKAEVADPGSKIMEPEAPRRKSYTLNWVAVKKLNSSYYIGETL